MIPFSVQCIPKNELCSIQFQYRFWQHHAYEHKYVEVITLPQSACKFMYESITLVFICRRIIICRKRYGLGQGVTVWTAYCSIGINTGLECVLRVAIDWQIYTPKPYRIVYERIQQNVENVFLYTIRYRYESYESVKKYVQSKANRKVFFGLIDLFFCQVNIQLIRRFCLVIF